MKVDGKLSRAGKVFLGLTAAWVLFLLHSAAVQYQMFQGLRLAERDERIKHIVWWQRPELAQVPADVRERWRAAEGHLLAADRLGITADVRIPRERSWIALAEGRVNDSAAHLEEALRRRPDAVNNHRDLAHLNMLRGQPARAIEMLHEALRLRPHDVESRVMLVAVLVEARDFKTAIVEQRKLLEHDSSPAGRIRLASIIIDGGDLEGGIAELRATVAAHPDSAPAHATLALALQGAGRADEAAPHIKRAEELNPRIFQQAPR
jgi:tetratricopeptide (TPR) repeat protein